MVIHIVYSGVGGHSAVAFSLISGGLGKPMPSRIYFFGACPVPDALIIQATALGVISRVFTFKQGSVFSALQSTIRLISALLIDRPRVIICHSCVALIGACLYKVLSFRRTKLLYRDNIPTVLKRRLDNWIMRFAIPFTDAFIFLTPRSQEEGMEVIKGYGRVQTSVISNGTDCRVFKSAMGCLSRTPAEYNTFRIGMASRMEPGKEPQCLIRATEILRNRGHAVHLYLAGEGALLPELQALVSSLDLSDRVHFHGLLAGESLVDFYNSLDIYVHSSLSETQSNSVIQAIACGLPVVGTDIPGINDVVHESFAVLVPASSVESLASGIERFLDVPTRVKASSAARAFALEKYDSRIMVARYSDLIC